MMNLHVRAVATVLLYVACIYHTHENLQLEKKVVEAGHEQILKLILVSLFPTDSRQTSLYNRDHNAVVGLTNPPPKPPTQHMLTV